MARSIGVYTGMRLPARPQKRKPGSVPKVIIFGGKPKDPIVARLDRLAHDLAQEWIEDSRLPLSTA